PLQFRKLSIVTNERQQNEPPDAKDGRRRAVIEAVEPQVQCGAFPIKRIVGDTIVVRADVFGDGHDAIDCVLLYQAPSSDGWQRVPMRFLNNDRWEAAFQV